MASFGDAALSERCVVFICPGCKTQFRLNAELQVGNVKCPKCGTVSPIQQPNATPPSQDSPQPRLTPDSEIAGHQIVAHTGTDEITFQYKAMQTSMGRTVLVRLLRPKHAANKNVRTRFFAEARAIARLNHPNLQSVFDMRDEGGNCFFTTEFVDGGTLPQLLTSPDKISFKDRLMIATQIGRALAYAQSSGVEELWIEPEDVLLTDKLDVRIGHVGAKTPLRGGTPEPIMNVLVRLMHLVAAAKDLPPELRSPGAAAGVPLPTVHDPLGGKLIALVGTLMSDSATYANASEFTAELERITEGADRRSVVSTATASGGVMPIRLDRARRRRISTKTILVATGIATALCAIVLWGILDYYQTTKANKKALALFNSASIEGAKSETLRDALRTLQDLATHYPKTIYGKDAKAKWIDRTKTAIIAHEFEKAGIKAEKSKRDTDKAVAEFKATEAALLSEFSDAESTTSFIKRQTQIHIENFFTRYHRAARREWKTSTFNNIQGCCRRDQYGQAIAAAKAFAKKWPKAPERVAAAQDCIKQAEGLAEEAYNKAKAEADELAKTGKADKILQAIGIFERIMRNYGIEKYVKQAEEEITKLGER